MDGASPWRVLRRITLPVLMPNLIMVLVLALIRTVQIFDEVFVLTGGGPRSATTFIVQFIYQTGFAEQIHLYGLPAAASLLLGNSVFITVVATLTTLLFNSMAAFALSKYQFRGPKNRACAHHRHADDSAHHHPGAGAFWSSTAWACSTTYGA